MIRSTSLLFASTTLVLLIAGAYSGCDSGGGSGTPGTAGTSATGAAGTSATGAAGTSATGAAGTSATGAAGTGAAGTGAAGTGAAGTGAAGTGAAGTGAAGTGAAGTGAAGTGAAGTGAAGTGAAGTGAAGMAGKTAVANITMLPGGTIMGTATFTAAGADVTVKIDLTNCPTGTHGIHIHEGTGCGSTAAQGSHWGPQRGEGIGTGQGQIVCDAQMKASLTYTRMGTAANLRWTIGDGATSDIVGHPVVVHGLDMADRHGCGVITMQ
jgi:PPE-repeat protein